MSRENGGGGGGGSSRAPSIAPPPPAPVVQPSPSWRNLSHGNASVAASAQPEGPIKKRLKIRKIRNHLNLSPEQRRNYQRALNIGSEIFKRKNYSDSALNITKEFGKGTLMAAGVAAIGFTLLGLFAMNLWQKHEEKSDGWSFNVASITGLGNGKDVLDSVCDGIKSIFEKSANNVAFDFDGIIREISEPKFAIFKETIQSDYDLREWCSELLQKPETHPSDAEAEALLFQQLMQSQ
jgi:hypothetical protein